MASISSVGSSQAAPQKSTSTIGGKGLSTTFDRSSTIVGTLTTINQAFSNSYLKLNVAVSAAQISKDSLESLLKITDKLISIATRAEDENLSDSERVSLNNDFQKYIKNFKTILKNTKEEGVDLLDKKELIDAFDNVGIDISETEELSNALAKIAGIDNILGYEKVRPKDVNVKEVISRQKAITQLAEKTQVVGNGTFNSSASIPPADLQYTPSALITGLVNSDNYQDIIIAGNHSVDGAYISVLLGNSDGTFKTGSGGSIGGAISDIVLNDIDNDSIQDIITLDGDGTIRLGLAGGAVTYTGPGAGSNYGLEIGDINNDNIKDLIYSNYLDTGGLPGDGGSYVTLIGKADGTFNSATSFLISSVPDPLTSLQVSDVDNDGKNEVLISIANRLDIYRDTGAGNLVLDAQYNTGGGTSDIFSIDINKDGYNDIVTSGSEINILLNNGNGTFKSRISFQALSQDIKVVDYDSDTNLDILTSTSGNITLLRGNGDGSFLARVSVITGSSVADFSVVDFNGDGALDIASLDTVDLVTRIFLANGETEGELKRVGNAAFDQTSPLSGRANGEYSAGDRAGYVELSDLNTDGYLDAVISSIGSGGGTINILRGNGSGSFDKNISYVVGSRIDEFYLADISGSAHKEIIATDRASGTIRVLSANSDGTFTSTVSYSATTGVSDIVVADINNDGFKDIIAADQSNGRILLYYGNNNGTFKSRVSVTASVNKIEVRDIDGDTFLDIVSGLASGVGINILKGNGDGTFKPVVSYQGLSNSKDILFGDYNEDGVGDIVTSAAGRFSILYGNSDGTYSSSTSYLAGSDLIQNLKTTDYDSDGFDDVIVTLGFSQSTKLFLGNGNGSFKAPISYISGKGNYGLGVGDVNNDGTKDIVTTATLDDNLQVNIGGNYISGSGGYTIGIGTTKVLSGDLDSDGNIDLVSFDYNSGSGSTVSISFGNGDSSFKAPVSYEANLGSSTGVLIDTDGDNKLDIAYVNKGNRLSVLTNNGNGTFNGMASTVLLYTNIDFIEKDDFNGDGTTDLIFGISNSSQLGVVLSNSDGTFKSRSDYVFDSGENVGHHLADLNNDGSVDIIAYSDAAFGFNVLLGSQDGSFNNPYNISSLSSNYSFKTADVNKDGNLDIVSSYANGFDIFLGTGDGTFNNIVSYQSSSLNGGSDDFEIKDFNNDSNLDIVALNSVDNSFYALLGNANGTFKNGISYTLNKRPASLLADDFNNDGVNDTLIHSFGRDNIDIFTGIVTTTLAGNGDFNSPSTFSSAGGSLSDLKYVDINRDGNLDAVTADDTGNSFSIFIGNGNGTFKTQVSYLTGTPIQRVEAVDVNFDGVRDIISTSESGDATYVSFGNSNGTFNASRSFRAGDGVNNILVTDINRDGIRDIVTTSSVDSSLNILLGNSNGSFNSRVSIQLRDVPTSLSVGDFNQDGINDLTVGLKNQSAADVFIGNGNGTFKASLSLRTISPTTDTVVEDFNRDGIDDIVVSSSVYMNVFLGSGDGTFSSRATFKTINPVDEVKSVDFDNDGAMDLVSISEITNSISLYLNNGDGSFKNAVTISSGSTGVSGVSFGDLNNDGGMDLGSVSNSTDNKLYSFIAKTVTQIAKEDVSSVTKEKRKVSVIQTARNNDPLNRDLQSLGQSLIAKDSLKKLREIIKKDLSGIDDLLTDLKNANELALRTVENLQGLNPSAIGSEDQLISRVSNQLRGSSSNLLLNINSGLTQDLLQKILRG